ncbi:B3 domain-containing protein [Vitis vinifera]|uniref:B3 domain-containing protein n=1 Tax=Vitis vinifera TaxID=29760 RepID=A0A438EF15_VITVI|nr:B3 domain-containing protein [Vitis vinifera]
MTPLEGSLYLKILHLPPDTALVAWPPHFFLPLPERLKDPVKNWSQSQPVGHWRAPNLFNTSIPQSDLRPRMPSEADLSTGVDRLIVSERSSASSMEKKKIEDSSERSMNGGLKLGALEMLENGNSGTNCEEQPASCVNIPQQSSSLNDDHSAPLLSLAVPYASSSETNGQTVVSGTLSQPTPSPPLAKKFSGHPHNGVDSSGEAQVRNGRPRGDARGRNQLLPRYWPRITDQELQQISGEYPLITYDFLSLHSIPYSLNISNSVITPLFEKMLSASDAGRIGRLVLPKKCAEAYFPAISQPEGLPLKVQDAKGHEWIFQFRFWPNNNSRMYVLEGVTPCIQSMQLQAGDTGNHSLEKQASEVIIMQIFYLFMVFIPKCECVLVIWFSDSVDSISAVTFSRLEPEGKLVMGFRKASTAPSSDQGNETIKTGNGGSTHGDVSIRKTKTGEVALTNRHLKSSLGSPSFSSMDQADLADPASAWSKVDKSGYIAKEALGAKSSIPRKRKNSTLGSKSKRLRIENEDLIELKLTWEEAQGLLRPPLNHVPNVVVIEGYEFEEYEVQS